MASTLFAVPGRVEVLGAVLGAPGLFDAGLGRFLVFPGLVGLSALVGGGLAYVAATRKGADDRESARQQRWWEALTWIYDRATAERPDGRPTGSLALDMLERLYDQAHTDLEDGNVHERRLIAPRGCSLEPADQAAATALCNRPLSTAADRSPARGVEQTPARARTTAVVR